jgi:hypothetical protein
MMDVRRTVAWTVEKERRRMGDGDIDLNLDAQLADEVRWA